MVNIGILIKLERIKQNIKQVNLARGICSTSYLSKIENNITTASDEIIDLLLKKLNIKLPQSTMPKEENIFNKELREIYKEITINRENTYANKQLKKLGNLNFYSYDSSTIYFLSLVIVRLTLSVGDMESSKSHLKFLNKEIKNLSNIQFYFYKKNLGIYYFLIQDMLKATESFQHALRISNEFHLKNWEKADLNYMIGLVYNVDNQILSSLNYTKMALDFFNNAVLSERIIDCYVLLGITYKKANRHRESLNTFKHALDIIDRLSLNDYKGLIYHNMGSLYSLQNSNKSLMYYQKSLSYKKKADDKLITVFSMIKEYSKMEKWSKVMEWVQDGLILCNQSNRPKGLYFHHFLFYEALSKVKNEFQDKASFISVAEKVIIFFDGIKDYRYCHKYSIQLGNYYFQVRNFKAAALTYQKAQNYLLKYKKLYYIEDL